MERKAKFLKKLDGFTGDARLYQVNPPMVQDRWNQDTEKEETLHHDYVVVSGVNGPLARETYIFPAHADGQIKNWGEMEGSFKGGVDHAKALEGAGYTVE